MTIETPCDGPGIMGSLLSLANLLDSDRGRCVELVDHKGHIIWVRGLDALDRTPVLDIKPYPDWEHGHLQVVVDFKIPEWLEKIIEQHP